MKNILIMLGLVLLLITCKKEEDIKVEQIVVGEKETNGITNSFDPIIVKEIYGTSHKKIAFNGVDYFDFSKYFFVSLGDQKEHHYQYIGTLNGCTLHSLNGEPYIHKLNDIVNVKDTFMTFDGSSFFGTGELYFAFRIQNNDKNYLGWLKVNSSKDLTIEDYCYYEVH